MAGHSFWSQVKEVLNLVKEHSQRYQRPKQATTRAERLSGWASLAGGVIFVGGEVLRQMGKPTMYLALSMLGLTVFIAGAATGIVAAIRAMRRPFVDHIDRVVEALDREQELMMALERFEPVILRIARKRLQLQSTKVASRLGMIGGSEGLRTSLVGIAMLAATLVSQYEPVIHGWTMKSLAFFGVVLLLGLSIGGLLVRYGASEADYYSEILGIALERRAYMGKKPHRRFQRHRAANVGGRSK